MATPRHLIHQQAHEDWSNIGDAEELESAVEYAEESPNDLVQSVVDNYDFDWQEGIAYQAEWFGAAASSVAKRHPKLAARARCVADCFRSKLRS